jgi:hypothetical protein
MGLWLGVDWIVSSRVSACESRGLPTSTKDGVEATRLCAFTPPSTLCRIFPWSMNNPR